jgi:hypothetical protein
MDKRPCRTCQQGALPVYSNHWVRFLVRQCRTIALQMLLLAAILTPSPLVLWLLVLLVTLPCLPPLRPLYLALPALESGNVSNSL